MVKIHIMPAEYNSDYWLTYFGAVSNSKALKKLVIR
jgi:hypothetical protein